jgi:hypothetical protein
MTRNSGLQCQRFQREVTRAGASDSQLRHLRTAQPNQGRADWFNALGRGLPDQHAADDHSARPHRDIEPDACRVESYTRSMSAIDPASEPVGLTVLPPEDALHSAKPAPTDSELVIDGLTEAEWVAFETALTDK